MQKPRLFLGSSGKQEKLLRALTRGLSDIADVEPWTTVFNPGISTLDRLVELTHEVDFAAFVFAQDDWTAVGGRPTARVRAGVTPRQRRFSRRASSAASLGMRRTFILHANGAKLPTDLLGLTCVRYGDASTPAEMRAVNQKVRNAIDAEGRIAAPGRPVVAALVDGADRGGAVGCQPAADLTGPVRCARGRGPRLAGGWHLVVPLLERGGEGDGATRPASSTTGTASARVTRTPRSSTEPQRSALRAPIARPATGRPVRKPRRSSARGRPESTCEQTPGTWMSSTRVSRSNAPS